MPQKPYFIIAFFFIAASVFAQENRRAKEARLATKSFGYLRQAALAHATDCEQDPIYVRSWLAKAKREQDQRELTDAYKATLYLAEWKQQLPYADSMLVAAQRTKDALLIGSAYLTRASVYYGRKEPKQALDNFLQADKYLSTTNDRYSHYKVKYGIAQTKYYLGFYDEAISLFRECIDYFKEENDRAYLNSLHCLGLCYNRIGNYDWCTLTNQIGLDEGKRLGTTEMICYFTHSEGVNHYFKGRYAAAIQKLTTVLPDIIRLKDFGNEAVAYFYVGKSYWALKQPERAVLYFKKADSLFVTHKYIRPDLREGYEKLIDYYKQRQDTAMQLHYIDQLLAVDRVLAPTYTYLLQKIVKEYDTKELLQSKQALSSTMAYRTYIGGGIILVLVVFLICILYRHHRNKKRFLALMQRPKEKEFDSEQPWKTDSIAISPELERAILTQLEQFEQRKKYLEKDMNLTRMATLLNTNTKYVTKIIGKHRHKGTIEYITDLKTDYIITLLKTETKYRHYTNKALGEEAGFGSTQNFTKAFKARTNLSPTFFISQLKKTGASELAD